jgi:hypothetical protein
MQSFRQYADQYDPFQLYSIPGSPVIPSVIGGTYNLPSMITFAAPPNMQTNQVPLNIPPINFNFPSTIQLDASNIPSQIQLNWPPVQTNTYMGTGGVLPPTTTPTLKGTPLGQYLGIGMAMLGDPNNIVFKRKFRWTLELLCGYTKILSPVFVKVAARPNVTIEETELDYLNAKQWIPGRRADEITVTLWGDTSDKDLANIYKNATEMSMAGNLTGHLKLWDGCGQPIEEWKLGKAYVKALNFGELDYTSSEEITIEMTLIYGEIQYMSHCPSSGGQGVWGPTTITDPKSRWEYIKGKVVAYCPAAATVFSGL